MNRKDGPVVVATPYGIRYRQLGQWIRAQESMQLFKRPAKVKTYRSFILPATPLKTLMVDTMDLGKWAGGAQGRQRFVIGTARQAGSIGGGNSRRSSSTGDAALLHKTAENGQLNKMRSAAPQIGAPRQAASPPSSPPRAQQCWLRCRSSSGDPAPSPAAARGCAAASSSRGRSAAPPAVVKFGQVEIPGECSVKFAK